MTDKSDKKVDLAVLEMRVDELISKIDLLQSENDALHQQQGHLTNERADLIKKVELARSRIESIIVRLKSMEMRP